MGKPFVVLALLLAVWAPLAQAQVAVPEIAPATVRIFSAGQPGGGPLFLGLGPMTSIVPENPAALQWGTPSRLAVGAVDGEMGTAIAGTADSYEGNFAGARFVWERFALAAEQTSLEVAFPDPAGVGISTETSRSAVGLSFSWPETLAFGLASESTSTERRFPGSPPGMAETDRWTAGVSWRVGETFFLGGGFGRDTVTFEAPPPGFEATADHYMAGLGWRVPGDVVWHLEADWFKRERLNDDMDQPIPGTGHEATLLNVEAIWGSWLFAASGYNAKEVDAPANAPELDGYTADFGYAPLEGFTITWRFEHSEVTADVLEISKEESNNLALSWQF